MTTFSFFFRIKPQAEFVLISGLSMLLQMIILGKHLTNTVLSSFSPSAVDAVDYLERARIWSTIGFSAAFEDLWRMPGYPAVIVMMQALFPSFPFLALRLLQMLAIAISVGLMKLTLDRLVSRNLSLIFSAFFSFLPIWYFSPVLLPESLTTLTLTSILYCLSTIKSNSVKPLQILLISLLLALSVYLRSNLIFFVFPIIIFLFFKIQARKIELISIFVALVFVFLSPWLIFTKTQHSGFIGLTSNFGINAYIGTGMVLNYDGGILAGSAMRWGVDPKSHQNDLIDLDPPLPRVEQSKILTEKAIGIWRERPLKQIGYGVDKFLIAFSLKGNSIASWFLAVFVLSSFFSSFRVMGEQHSRSWGGLYLTTILLLATQAFFLQADRRYVFPTLMPLALVCLALATSQMSFFRPRLGGAP